MKSQQVVRIDRLKAAPGSGIYIYIYIYIYIWNTHLVRGQSHGEKHLKRALARRPVHTTKRSAWAPSSE